MNNIYVPGTKWKGFFYSFDLGVESTYMVDTQN